VKSCGDFGGPNTGYTLALGVQVGEADCGCQSNEGCVAICYRIRFLVLNYFVGKSKGLYLNHKRSKHGPKHSKRRCTYAKTAATGDSFRSCG
jgi:hypothetical protein